MDNNEVKKRMFSVSKDFLLNLLASLITTGVSQLILYPFLASMLSDEVYGQFLTLIGIANTMGVACGGSLNNTRLLVQPKYEEGVEKGDFPIILLILTSSSALLSFFVFKYGLAQATVTTWLLILFIVLCLIRSYITVEYRIVLCYKKILISNVFLSVGNLLGVLVLIAVKKIAFWPVPFVLGELVCFGYLLKTTGILKESLHKTPLFNIVFTKESILLVTFLATNLLTYLDRLLLLPLLGGGAVSKYTVASVFGKSVGILMTPLASVLLSYYTRKGFSMSRKLFWKINLASLACGFTFVILSLVFAPFMIKILYSSMYLEAKPYLLIANITAIINIVASMIQPSVLRFAPTVWQLIVQIVYCAVYILGGIWATEKWELWGFSVVALMAAIIKMVMLMGVGNNFIVGEDK